MVTCIACLEDVKSNASKCPHCGAYQNRWRNRLPMIGAIVAILAFMGSVATVLLATATDLFQQAFWRDKLEIITYESSGPLVAVNSGSGELFVEYVTKKSESLHYEEIRPIKATIPKDSIRSLGARKPVEGNFVRNMPDEQWELIKSGKVSGFEPYFFSKDHPQFKLLTQNVGESLRTFEAKCMIGFRSAQNQTLKNESFPCVGVMIAR